MEFIFELILELFGEAIGEGKLPKLKLCLQIIFISVLLVPIIGLCVYFAIKMIIQESYILAAIISAIVAFLVFLLCFGVGRLKKEYKKIVRKQASVDLKDK